MAGQGTCLINLIFAQTINSTGVGRIGLTSLNPKVCPSNQSESDPKLKKINPIRSEVEKSIQIRSDSKLKNSIRSNSKQIDQIRPDAKNS